LGLQRTGGFETIAFCEIDPFCRKVLAKHWPGVPCFEDITKLDKEELDSLGRVDVICGGFPCQDISCAGKGAGIHAERSGLWWEMLRIIRLVRPKFVLVENVAALLNRGLDEVLGSLAESGYNAEWTCLRASDVGAYHERERVFLMAYSDGFVGKRRRQLFSESRKIEELHIEASNIGTTHFAGEMHTDGRIWPDASRVRRVANGIPNRMDRLRALGNAIVPQCAQFVGQCLLDSIRTEAAQ